MNVYTIEAVVRPDKPGFPSEILVTGRVAAESELTARRVFLRRAWRHGDLVSHIYRVVQQAKFREE